MKTNFKKIYFDMDGVIADWVAAFAVKFPEINYENFNKMSKAERDPIKEKIANDPTFYRHLAPMHEAIRLLIKLHKDGNDVAILTSCGKRNTNAVARAKQEWLREILPFKIEFNFTKSSEDKAKYAGEGIVLIDDRMKSIGPFRAAGGIGILHTTAKETRRELLRKMLDS